MGDDSEGEAAQQQRRMRTKFTSEQISKLENTFSKHKYLGAVQRTKIAARLNLSETQVGLRSCWVSSDIAKVYEEVTNIRNSSFLLVWVQ